MELESIRQKLIDGDDESVAELTRQALNQGIEARTILEQALIAGMVVVGDLFEKNEYFVPELLLAARAMYAALDLLRPLLTKASAGAAPAAGVVIGTAQGDMHDIGKRLVAIMLEGAGYRVTDLGTDVSVERFVEAVKQTGARLVGISSLLTTTMPAMEKAVKAVKAAYPTGEVKVIVGGAPVTLDFANAIGADGYGRDANAAVALAKRLLG